MYRIEFFDANKKLIATHTITADNLVCGIFDADKYCQSIANVYSNIKRWSIFDNVGHLRLSARVS